MFNTFSFQVATVWSNSSCTYSRSKCTN